MKKLVFLIFFILIFTNIAFALPNPAAVYCKQMSYEYRIVKTPQGESGECIFPNGQSCQEWEFLKGKCGQQYSYCIKNGYYIKTVSDGKNPYSYDYAVCVPKSYDKKGISITDFITFDTDLITSQTTETNEVEVSSLSSTTSLPSYFDWRNNNGNWMTPVKNQYYCGSCWDFAAVGTVEAKMKIENNIPSFNPDLSEQDVLSCDSGSCNGGWSESALNYIKNTGVVDESCFPYTASDDPCSDKCSDWQNRISKISGWWYLPYGSDFKLYLTEEGPLTTYIGMSGYFDNKGIYKCDGSPAQNHAIVMVGYNDTGGYWIAKNSWGTYWGDNGYFKIYYGNCTIRPIAYVYANCSDEIPPANITDLSVNNSTTTKITLEMTSSGNDGTSGISYYYEIAYSKEPITESNYNSINKTIYYNYNPAGIKIQYTVNKLIPDTTYYFAVKVYDNCGNPSNLSNIASGSTKPPLPPATPVTDLSIINSSATSINLEWTTNSPYFDLRYSTSPINEDNFNKNTKMSWCEPPLGSIKKCKIMDLFPETNYYFAVKVYDDAEYPNLSNLSNIASGSTNPPKVILFDDNVENGNNGWNTSFLTNNISQQFGNPLWHITQHHSSSSSHSWYYGIEGQWNYDTDSANNGSLISSPINISNYSSIYLILNYSADLEPQIGGRWSDQLYGNIYIDGFPGMGGGIFFDNRSTNGEFVKRMILVGGSWGNTLQISFDFNSIDEFNNTYEGIYLDDVQIIANNYKPIANAGGPYINESGLTITFDGSETYDADGDPLIYSWYFGDNKYGNGKIIKHTYDKPGIYNVTMSVNDEYSQVQSYTTANVNFCFGNIQLSLSPNPVETSKNVTATISGLSNCNGKTASIIKSPATPMCGGGCIVSVSGCSCKFISPSTTGTYTYTAYIDKNGDGDYTDPGENSIVQLTVTQGGGGCGRSCLMRATLPYMLETEPVALVSLAVFAAIVIIVLAIITRAVVFRKTKHK